MHKLTPSISAAVAAAMACMDLGDGVATVAGVVMAIGAVVASAMLRQTLRVMHKLTLRWIRKQILRLIQSIAATEGDITVADLDAAIAATLRQRQKAKTKQSAKLSPRQLQNQKQTLKHQLRLTLRLMQNTVAAIEDSVVVDLAVGHAAAMLKQK